jgi:hypothetical protein
MYKLCAEILGCHFIRRVETPLFSNKESHYSLHLLQRGVNVDSGDHILKDPNLKRDRRKNHACRALLNRKILKVSKIRVVKGSILTPRCH